MEKNFSLQINFDDEIKYEFTDFKINENRNGFFYREI